MKKKMMTKVLAVLALSSTAFIFAGCGKKKETTTKPVDDEIKKTDGFSYKVFNGEVEIVGIDKKGASLVIPNEIDGSKVTRLSCTYTDKELTSVTIPSNLTYLTGNGFMGCENLSSVVFDGTSKLTDIPSKAFFGTKISTITIPASVRSISFEAFQDVDTLTSVTFESGSSLQTIGPFAFYGCDGITSVNLPSNLTSIGESAFEKCENLTTLTISNATKLTEIEQYAFSGCVGLTSLDFTSNQSLRTIGANAFRGCTNITSVTFDEALKEIGSKAFYNTQKITSLVLPSNLTSVGDEAFVNAGITSLEIKSGSDTTFGTNAFSQYALVGDNLVPLEQISSLTANGNLSLEKIFTEYSKQVRLSLDTLHVTGNRISSQAYKSCINLTNLTIDDSITAIGESAFEDCTLITEVTLNNGLTEIAINTFKNCVNLDTVTLPASVKTVRDGAFDGCVKVTNLDLSNLTFIGANAFRSTSIPTQTFSAELTEIGASAFENCINIDEVFINTTVSSTTIRQCAFKDCKFITNIYLSSNVVMGNNVFENDTNVETIAIRGEYGLDTLFGEGKEETAKKITSITIQDKTEIIEDKAFFGCLLVEEIILPSTVKTIGDEAFRGCGGITTLNLPDTLEKIGKYAFADCNKLVLTELPDSIVDISEGMFENDFSIGEFTLNKNTTKIGTLAFSGCSNLEIKTIVEEDGVETEKKELNDSIKFIGNYAFSGCSKLELTKLPTSLEELGRYAFNGCIRITINETNASLEKIGDYAFKGCQAITSFEFAKDLGLEGSLGDAILDGCTKIEELKIYGTTSLQDLFGSESVSALKPILSKITIKEGSTSLADNMFNGFTAISVVTFESDITLIGQYAFAGCISLTSIDISKVEIIGEGAFSESGLEMVTIPSNGIQLGGSIFSGCASLSKVVFAELSTDESLNIKEIPANTFASTIIESITIPSSVTTIGEGAFSGILTLNEVEFSDDSKLTTIGVSAFSGCANILEFSIPSTVNVIGKSAFMGCVALRDVEFKTGNIIETINESTFQTCYALTNINLPNTIRTIDANAFADCSCLARISLPTTLDTIGSGAFAGCKSLNKLTIPTKIEKIASTTFKNCYMLSEVTWNDNIKTIEEEAFSNTPYNTTLPKTISYIGIKAFACDDVEKYPQSFLGDDIELGCEDDGVGLYIADSAFMGSGVKSVKLGAKITDLGISVFTKSSIQSIDFTYIKITKIGDSMFLDCESLATVVMKDEVNNVENKTINTVGSQAFKGTAITSFVFKNILSIGDSAFEATEDLGIAVTLGDSNNVTIGDKAFYQSGINKIVLGANVIKLGVDAVSESKITEADLSALNIVSISDNFFANCEALATVKVNTTIRTIGASAFTGCKALADLNFLNIDGMVLEQIMDNAFEGCEKLGQSGVEIVIPNSVSYVGLAAFKGCSALSKVSWSTSANVINDNTFNGCNSLVNFTVPANVSRIGQFAFNPTSAGTYKFLSEIAPSLDEEFCSNTNLITFEVPNGRLEAYLNNYVFSKLQHVEES